MEFQWFEYLFYGLISGFAELLPVSAVAHQAIFSKLVGGQDHEWLRIGVHIGVLAAVLIAFAPTLSRYRREKRISKLPKSRRNRQPDFGTLMELRVLKTAAVSMLILLLAYGLVHDLYERLWLLAIFVSINGIVLFLPQHLPSANKNAESLSGLDAMLIGLTAGLGVIPGFSRFGCGMAVARIRGTDRRYAADLNLLLAVPAMVGLIVIDLLSGVTAGVTVTGLMIFGCIGGAAMAFLGAYLAIRLVRFMAYHAGFSAFAYYCWGFALFSIIIYLI